jgi:primosomal protein N' (replication factor Y) (superfamily II helicase)
MIANVIVDVNVKQLNRPFDYLVPKDLESLVEPGSRVLVTFGARNIIGFVIQLTTGDDIGLKPIHQVLDVVPSLPKELLELGQVVAKETSANLIAVYKLMIPAALRSTTRAYMIKDNQKIYLDTLSPLELRHVKAEITVGRFEVLYDIKQAASQKTKTVVTLVDSSYVPTSSAQALLLNELTSTNDASLLKKQAGASAYKTLLKKEVIQEKVIETYRDIELTPNPKRVTLTAAQELVTKSLSPGIHLLHGITGSGKTEVYLAAIEQTLEQGRNALYLVPEISLTYQTVARLVGRFKNQVAILHSGLSMGERYDEWRKILRGEVRVVVGARSAVFAPLDNIGVIIVDEEHDSSYKQEDTPRYHARDVAKLRQKTHQSVLILGSATPGVETYARAMKEVYQYHHLPERVTSTYPDIQVIDMTEQTSVISTELRAAMTTSLELNQQVLLLLNRRGYHNYVICEACGHVPKCKDCDVSLTYHHKKHKLQCHYCGYQTTPTTTCVECGSDHLQYEGMGTEQLQDHVQTLFPDQSIIRMDKDTTSTKQAHQTYLNEFEAGQHQILIGTQMIAKGLDFINVGVVGVLDIDSLLHLPDFHSSERTFQLITQVAGRAGRHHLQGKVFVQTLNPNHYAIQSVYHDYEWFYHQEMKYRKLAGYVPYYYVELLLLQGDDMKVLFHEADKIKGWLKKQLSSQAVLLGPTVPTISRIKTKYRVQLVLKYKRESGLLATYETLLGLVSDQVDVTIDRTPSYIG